MEKEKLLEIRNIIEDVKNNGLNETYIKELYRIMGNTSIPLVFTTMGFNTAAFSPKYMSISVNVDKSKDWINKTTSESKEYFEIRDEELVKAYFLISLLGHEIEHSNQKLIAEGIKEAKYEYMCQAYNDVFDVMKQKKYIIPRPISLIRDIVLFSIYQANAYNFILERNASVEGYNLTSSVAESSGEKDIMQYMVGLRNAYMIQGYQESAEGALKYTYRKLYKMKKYNSLYIPSDIPLDEKARLGLEVSEEERDKVILALKQTTKFK